MWSLWLPVIVQVLTSLHRVSSPDPSFLAHLIEFSFPRIFFPLCCSFLSPPISLNFLSCWVLNLFLLGVRLSALTHDPVVI